MPQNNGTKEAEAMNAIITLAHQMERLIAPGVHMSIPIGNVNHIHIPGKPDKPRTIMHISKPALAVQINTK